MNNISTMTEKTLSLKVADTLLTIYEQEGIYLRVDPTEQEISETNI